MNVMKMFFEGGVQEMHCAYAQGATGMHRDDAMRALLEQKL